MKKSVKAQAAMEFLMTYGWAILVVLVVIGALSYFGVLNPGKLLPDKCLFGPGLGKCNDEAAISDLDGNGNLDDGVIWVLLSNGLGKSINSATISSSGDFSCDFGAVITTTPSFNAATSILGGDSTAISQALSNGDLKIIIPDQTIDPDSYNLVEFLCGGNTASCAGNWNTGQEASILFTNCNGIADNQKIQQEVTINYRFVGATFNHIIEGSVSTTARTNPFLES